MSSGLPRVQTIDQTYIVWKQDKKEMFDTKLKIHGQSEKVATKAYPTLPK